MRDGIIYVRDNQRRFEARDVLNWIQTELAPGDSITLPDLCHMIETWADKTAFDPEWPEEDDDDAR